MNETTQRQLLRQARRRRDIDWEQRSTGEVWRLCHTLGKIERAIRNTHNRHSSVLRRKKKGWNRLSAKYANAHGKCWMLRVEVTKQIATLLGYLPKAENK